MIDRIKSITSEGLVKFTDKRSGKETFSSKVNCEAYGYKYVNGKCYAFRDKDYTNIGSKIGANNTERGNNNIARGVNNEINGYGNHIYGNHNLVTGIDNTILGKSNNVDASYSVAIGNNVSVENDYVFSKGFNKGSNRAFQHYFIYSGETTNQTPTEIFIAGIDGNRYYINEDYYSSFAGRVTVNCYNYTDNEVFTQYLYSAWKVDGGTLRHVNTPKSEEVKEGSTQIVTLSAVSGTPDYLKVVVQGVDGNATLYWTISFDILENRFEI